MTTEVKRLHAHVHGRVQGVGFRYFVLECANRLALAGWARNRFDGSVEVVAEGTMDQLENLVADLQRGSRSSNVERVETHFSAASGEFERFSIRSTG